MNTDIIAGEWKKIVGHVKSTWADLTDDDVKKAEAGRDHLIGVVQVRYGRSKDEAHKEVQAFLDKHDEDKKFNN